MEYMFTITQLLGEMFTTVLFIHEQDPFTMRTVTALWKTVQPGYGR